MHRCAKKPRLHFAGKVDVVQHIAEVAFSKKTGIDRGQGALRFDQGEVRCKLAASEVRPGIATALAGAPVELIQMLGDVVQTA